MQEINNFHNDCVHFILTDKHKNLLVITIWLFFRWYLGVSDR